eukprot:scaffold7617_cov143-Cylindrotheca_fusiformis.AAC.2
MDPWPDRQSDPQWYFSAPRLTIHDIWVYVVCSGFLSDELRNLITTYFPGVAVCGGRLGPFWISRPWKPIRRRLWGFGTISKDRICVHDKPNPLGLIHFAWVFLSPLDRLKAMRIHSSWQKYAALRRKACTKSVAWLRYPRSDVAMARMSQGRALSHTMALLRFDFDYGDFIRWMGGEYTNRHRDWNAEWHYLLSLPCRDLPSGYPPPNYELAYRIQTEGVPLKGTYDTPMAATIEREQYDNHPAVQQNSEEVHKKFAKEEWKGYHVHFQ